MQRSRRPSARSSILPRRQLDCGARRLTALHLHRRCAGGDSPPVRRHDDRSRRGAQPGKLSRMPGPVPKPNSWPFPPSAHGAPIIRAGNCLRMVRSAASFLRSHVALLSRCAGGRRPERAGRRSFRDAVDPAEPGAGIIQVRGEAFGPRGAHRVVALTVARAGTGAGARRASIAFVARCRLTGLGPRGIARRVVRARPLAGPVSGQWAGFDGSLGLT